MEALYVLRLFLLKSSKKSHSLKLCCFEKIINYMPRLVMAYLQNGLLNLCGGKHEISWICFSVCVCCLFLDQPHQMSTRACLDIGNLSFQLLVFCYF